MTGNSINLGIKGIETQEDWETYVDGMSDEAVSAIAQRAVPWSSPPRINDEIITDGPVETDADGFPIQSLTGLKDLQMQCWRKFNNNPHINSHVRDTMGTLTGMGFAWGSHIPDIFQFMKTISEDIRNELVKFFPKFAARSEIEGELFLKLTPHPDGFVEVDFMEPTQLVGGPDGSGIYFHPKKKTMPIFYEFNEDTADSSNGASILIPSIYVAHYPDLAVPVIKKHKLSAHKLKDSKSRAKAYKSLKGYKSFIVSWDKGFLTKRNVSHIKTTLKWLNHYENLKEWEIDHKKSSGSYLWIVKMTEPKAFRTWLKMSDKEKAATGLMAKKTPGGTLVLPPGIEIDCKNPQLASISEQDTDIMHMITSGLNKPEDMVTGQTKGDTFSGIKASRGPQADRTQDQLAYFERFLRHDFWRNIFYLHHKMNPSFKLERNVHQATEFDKSGKAKFSDVITPIYDLISFEFPSSEVEDLEAKARAFLGVKHAAVSEILGIDKTWIASKIGIGNYHQRRLNYETEKKQYPDLPTTGELDSAQEKANEPTNPKPGTKKENNNK